MITSADTTLNQQQQQQPPLEFNTSAIKRLAILQKENESLRQELAQMRIAMIQINKQHQMQQQYQQQQQNQSNSTSPSGKVTTTTSPSSTSTFDTRKGGGGAAQMSKARKERVKVAFSLMSVKHAMQRLRHSVQELRTGVDSDFIDAKRMIDEKKVSIDARIATERPLIHKIHEAICELVRHGGNQKAEVLQHLFSSTSWGHTRMSLTQAAPDIVHEIESLVAVADQQRRAKEILEVAAIHKDRALERANKCVVEMAITARNVVASFAEMARSVHNMANMNNTNSDQAEAISNVKSLLVTRALTIPELEKFIPLTEKVNNNNQSKNSSSKSSSDQQQQQPPKELSLKQIEKFSRQLQDAAFAATTLLKSATQAVLEPEAVKVENNINNSPNNQKDSRGSSNNRKKKSISFQDDDVESTNNNNNDHSNSNEQQQPSLIKLLRKRWVKSVFQRAMLRMKFQKCLTSIHDDFVLNNMIYETERKNGEILSGENNEHQQQTSSSTNKKSSKQQKNSSLIAPSAPSSGSLLTEPHAKWASASVRPKAPVVASSSSNNHNNSAAQQQTTTTSSDQQQQQQQQPQLWTSEDDRRLKIHEQRHASRVKQLLGVSEAQDDEKNREQRKSEMKQTLHRKFLELASELEGGNKNSTHTKNSGSKSATNGHHHLKTTLLTSRRAMAAPAGSSANALGNLFATTNTSKLGRRSPLTGTVETAIHQDDGEHEAWKRAARSDFMGATSTGVLGANGTSSMGSLTAHHQNRLVMASSPQQHQHMYRTGSGGGNRNGTTSVAKNPHDDVTEGMRTKDPRWFQPITNNKSSGRKQQQQQLAPQPPTSKFANVPVRDTLKDFFVLSNDV